MRKMIMTATIVALMGMTACVDGSKTTNDQNAEAAQTTGSEVTNVYALDDLLSDTDQLINKTVKVTGYVTHTCKHSGKRCFITGESQKASMRVEAGGEIGGFNRELIGSKLMITGVLKERRLTQEYIAQAEKEVSDKKKMETGSVESCEAELANIAEIKAWMKEKGKDYYSIYYMMGENYEVVE